MHILIFTGGFLHEGRATTKTLSSYDLIIGVDSGTKASLSFKITPDLVVGDLDSIDTKTLNTLHKKNVKVIKYPREKDQSDTEIALETAVEMGATKISVLGGNAGDRIDHVLANMLLPTRYKIPIYFVDGNTTAWLRKGPAVEKIIGKKGDLLSLVPLSKRVAFLHTKGLKYTLLNDTLFLGRTRGISNVFVANTIEVAFSKGLLLLSHTIVA